MDSALQRLGITRLRPKQRKILKWIEKGRDVFGLLPTGYGKSACYIIPHLLTQKNVIVISPLIALMHDQHQTLTRNGIPAISFNSHTPTVIGNTTNPGEVMEQLRNGTITGVLYFSPEKFLQHELLVRKLVKLKKLALVAVDEAHCVVTWSDFRTVYRRLSCITNWTTPPVNTPAVPILALTASATPQLMAQLVSSLGLRRPKLVQASFKKAHLSLNFREKQGFDQDLQVIASEIRDTDTKTVIYCKTHRETERLSNNLGRLLQSDDIPVAYYHGGLNAKDRLRTQSEFTSQPRGVMVATIAFGMGIDIPDIHLLIHYGISRDIESYYQEIGRSGRDGGAAECIAFYGRADFSLNRRFATNIADETHRTRQLEACLNLERLIRDPGCRMLYLTSYFGETGGNPCGRCDNCEQVPGTSTSTNTISPIIGYLTLSALINLEYGCGINTLVGILTGSQAKRLNARMKRLPEYGKLKHFTQASFRPKLEDLLYNGMLQQQNTGKGGVTYLNVSPVGRDWFQIMRLKIKASIDTLTRNGFSGLCRKFIASRKQHPTPRAPRPVSGEAIHPELQKWRQQLASERKVPPFYILTNATLVNLTTTRPATIDVLRSVKGIGPQKIKDYGQQLLAFFNQS